jgi:hypothetical protein
MLRHQTQVCGPNVPNTLLMTNPYKIATKDNFGGLGRMHGSAIRAAPIEQHDGPSLSVQDAN